MKKLWSFVASVLRYGGWTTGLVATLIAVLSLLDHAEVFSSECIFFGVDLVSPLWIFALFVSGSILALLGGAKRFWIPTVIGAAFFLFCGDISLLPLRYLLSQRVIATERTINVATLNVQYFSEGVDRVMDAIDQLNADITLLGEHVLTPEQAKTMQHRLNGRTLVAGHPNSTAILSRFPIVWWREVELPSHEASLSGGNDPDEIIHNRHRSFVHAVVHIRSRYVHIISVRYIAGRPKDRTFRETIRWGQFMISEQLREANFLLQYISALRGPVIFGGDLNVCPGSKAVACLKKVATDAYPETNFFGALTFRTEFPTMRLDYLFSMNGVMCVGASRPHIVVSDHFPVIGSFMLPEGIVPSDSSILPSSPSSATVRNGFANAGDTSR